MEDSQHPQSIVDRSPVDRIFIVPVEIIEESHVRGTGYRGQVELHLYAADPVKIFRIDEPFRTLAVAFQEAAPPG
jgi:hypothetical protein